MGVGEQSRRGADGEQLQGSIRPAWGGGPVLGEGGARARAEAGEVGGRVGPANYFYAARDTDTIGADGSRFYRTQASRLSHPRVSPP